LRALFVETMVKHQVADKSNDAAPLDHVWSSLVEKVFYGTQANFEKFAAARPKRLFVDYMGDLEKSKEPDQFVHALKEALWWCRANMPQDPAVWAQDFGVYVTEIEASLQKALDQSPKLLAPNATTGEAAAMEAYNEIMDEMNKYRSFETTKQWWSQLGDWKPVTSAEDGTITHFEREVAAEEEGAEAYMEYAYEYPVPPEPGNDEAAAAFAAAEGGYHDEDGNWVDTGGEGGYYDEEGNWIDTGAQDGGYYDEDGNWIEGGWDEGADDTSKKSDGKSAKSEGSAKGGKKKKK